MAGTYLTKEGLEKLQKQLEELRSQKRRLSKEVGVAREYGDLRENAEYHAAKERLQQVLARISDLEFKLSNVNVIDPAQLDHSTATLGTRLKVKDLSTAKESEYTLVGPEESDPGSGKISVASPLGRAFLRHKAKEEVTVTLPAGARTYRILTIQPAVVLGGWRSKRARRE
ncbi:MAG: transcription elongation factor GreA [Candidatus Omnitrophica bacterium]|nr:transcription elongation factor GreA [Candidatus Omnitrophota bacterium]